MKRFKVERENRDDQIFEASGHTVTDSGYLVIYENTSMLARKENIATFSPGCWKNIMEIKDG